MSGFAWVEAHARAGRWSTAPRVRFGSGASGGDVRLRPVRVSDAEPAVPHVDGGYRAGARCRAPCTRAARDLCAGVGCVGFAVVLALPALLLGASATGAMLKIALKTFINVSLVLGVSWTLTWNRMSAALKTLHLPDEVIFTFDMALKHIEVLGRTAHDLTESVMLRSVGRAPEGFSRTDSVAGIMGMTFIKAMECSRAMDEAMLCRGFAGAYPAPRGADLAGAMRSMRSAWRCSPCCVRYCSAGGLAVDASREGRRFDDRYE